CDRCRSSSTILKRIMCAIPSGSGGRRHHRLAEYLQATFSPNLTTLSYSQSLLEEPDFVGALFGRGDAPGRHGHVNDLVILVHQERFHMDEPPPGPSSGRRVLHCAFDTLEYLMMPSRSPVGVSLCPMHRLLV